MKWKDILPKQITHGGSTLVNRGTICMINDKYILEGQLWRKAWLIELVK